MIYGMKPKPCAAFRRIFSANAAYVFLAGGIVAGCVALAHCFGLTICPMKRWLGVPCPTCGATRAFALLLHGEIRGAFELQPLVMALACLALPLLLLFRIAFGKQRMRTLIATASKSPIFWCIVVLITLANWAYVIARGN